MELSKSKVVLVGYSGHGLVVAESAKAAGLQVKYYAEIKKLSSDPFGLDYLGFEASDGFEGWKKGYGFITGIGDNVTRKKVSEIITDKGEKLLNVIHPSSSISLAVKTGYGVFIARNVSVSPLADIGSFSILNTGCIVEHECNIGIAAHVGPGAVLSGKVNVGECSFIGANAVVRQGISIGANVMVGAGAVVIKNIADNETWVGNPARRIK